MSDVVLVVLLQIVLWIVVLLRLHLFPCGFLAELLRLPCCGLAGPFFLMPSLRFSLPARNMCKTGSRWPGCKHPFLPIPSDPHARSLQHIPQGSRKEAAKHHHTETEAHSSSKASSNRASVSQVELWTNMPTPRSPESACKTERVKAPRCGKVTEHEQQRHQTSMVTSALGLPLPPSSFSAAVPGTHLCTTMKLKNRNRTTSFFMRGALFCLHVSNHFVAQCVACGNFDAQGVAIGNGRQSRAQCW